MLMKTISKAEYARYRGVSAGAVGNAIRRGKITPTPDGRINPITADAEWAYNRQRQPPIKTPVASNTHRSNLSETPSCHPALDQNERMLDHLAVWITWRYPSPQSDLRDLLIRWASPIPDRATLAVELKNMLTLFGENLDRLDEPEPDEDREEFD